MIPGKKISERIQQYLYVLEQKKYKKIADVSLEYWETKEVFRDPPSEVLWKLIQFPFYYGKDGVTYWFKTEFSVPETAADKELFFRALPNADSLVFLNSKPYGAINPYHEKIRISEKAIPGERYTIHMETYSGHHYAGCHPFEGSQVLLTLAVQIKEYPNIFSTAELVIKEPAFYDLYYDVYVLFELTKVLEDTSLRKHKILKGLYDALLELHLTDPEEEQIEQSYKVRKILQPLLQAKNGDTVPEVYLVGGAHIDHAWLWPIWETERKIARTYINMIRYIHEFPEFVFLQSQPCQMEIIEREYPEIFKEILEAYHREQWEPNGGMWVESDCNIPSGESLIRQFLMGKKTTYRIFGYESDTLWLPDVFGYSAALPQILSGCEIKYFVTSKINWNDTTRFPYDTFVWEGIDGSKVLTTYITARKNGYNGRVSPAEVVEDWENVLHKEIQSSLIKPIGEGDGGGGTLRSDLEIARRLGDLEGAPRTRWCKISDALGRLFGHTVDLPVWKGELYLELHRGTYTTQAKMKWFNRKLEFLLRECEYVYGVAFMFNLGIEYPEKELEESWKKVLTNQFHDIIPGSSIGAVYDQAEKEYEEIYIRISQLIKKAYTQFASIFYEDSFLINGESNQNKRYVVFNSFSWERKSLVLLPEFGGSEEISVVHEKNDEIFPVQKKISFDGSVEYYALACVPSMGIKQYICTTQSRKEDQFPFRYDGTVLETPFYTVVFDSIYRIISLQHKVTHMEFVPPNMIMNKFITADDLPVLWDAWDIDVEWKNSVVDECRLQESEVISQGALFFIIRNTYLIGKNSQLVQDCTFYANNPRIDFVSEVEWNEDHRLLKVEFPVHIHNHSAVKCEIQYGYVIRSTHENTPADRAQFEIPAHKWVCIDDGQAGFALLNDCKYGHDVRGSVLRLTLLRSPKAPDPEADMGKHRITYSILPIPYSFSIENVIHEAYDLNQPLVAVEVPSNYKTFINEDILMKVKKEGSFSFFWVDDPAVIIEVVKRAEYTQDGQYPLVIRMYESTGRNRTVTIHSAQKLSRVFEANMLERVQQEIGENTDHVTLFFRAFEIKTIMVVV